MGRSRLGELKNVSLYGAALLKSLVHSRIRYKVVPDRENQERTMILVGLGPSLKTDIESLPPKDPRVDFFGVNDLASKELYTRLRPKHYVLLDPMYWRNPTSSENLDARKEFFQALNRNTDWNIRLFVPCYANHDYVRTFISNPKIDIAGYNAVGIPYVNSDIYLRLLDLQVLAPHGDNVLIHAIYLSILLGYGEIYFIGANASWHEYLGVNQENNEVRIRMEHFDGKEEYAQYQDDEMRIPGNMAWTMGFIHRTFLSFEVVAGFAKYRDAKVYNASSFSWIDAFDRRPLPKLRERTDN